MALKKIIIQGSSVSWGGAIDDSVRTVDGIPTIIHTHRVLSSCFPETPVEVIAPKFDRNGGLNSIFSAMRDKVSIHYCFDESPLKRMVHATQDLDDCDHILRVNGANCFIAKSAYLMLEEALQGRPDIDCIKFPDDFPAQLTADVYRVGALRNIVANLSNNSSYQVHPKYFFQKNSQYSSITTKADHLYTDEDLLEFRGKLANLNSEDYLDVDFKKSIATGNQLLFHYVLASKSMVKIPSIVLDIACGSGYGASFLGNLGHKIIAGDINPQTLKYAQSSYGGQKNLKFLIMDVLDINYPEATFDFITSFETIEHLDDVDSYLSELKRVLKPNGLIFFSTPQNSLGHIPLTYHHNKEYGRSDLRKLIEQYFFIEAFYGIKQGCIFDQNDEVGNNSFIIARKNI